MISSLQNQFEMKAKNVNISFKINYLMKKVYENHLRLIQVAIKPCVSISFSISRRKVTAHNGVELIFYLRMENFIF